MSKKKKRLQLRRAKGTLNNRSWASEFESFYSPKTGIDIIEHSNPLDYLPIHALQPCNLPCDDPFQQVIEQSMPPRANPPLDPNTPIFGDSVSKMAKRWPSEDYFSPPYAINNAAGALSSKTFIRKFFIVLNPQTNCFTSRRTSNTPMGCWNTTPTTSSERWCPLRRVKPCWPIVLGNVLYSSLARTSSVLVHMVGKWLGDNVSLQDYYQFSTAGISDLRRSIKFRW